MYCIYHIYTYFSFHPCGWAFRRVRINSKNCCPGVRLKCHMTGGSSNSELRTASRGEVAGSVLVVYFTTIDLLKLLRFKSFHSRSVTKRWGCNEDNELMHFTILNEKNLSESPAQREVVPREIPLTQVQEWHDASTSAASGDASVLEKSVAFQILFFLRGINQYCNISMIYLWYNVYIYHDMYIYICFLYIHSNT